MKRILVAALALTLLAPQTAGSQTADADRLRAAEELVRLVYAAEIDDDLADSIIEARLRENPKLEPYREVLLEWARKKMSLEGLGRSLIDLYAREFSEAELREIIAFYRTPTGQKVLERTPALLSGLTDARLGLTKEWQGEVERLISEQIWKEGGAALRAHADQMFDQEKWSEARDAYLRYLEVHPKEVAVISDLGVCYRSVGDFQAALREFDRALALDSAHWQSLYNKIIVVGFDLNRKAEARELLAKLQVLQPDNESVQQLAEAIEQAGQAEER